MSSPRKPTVWITGSNGAPNALPGEVSTRPGGIHPSTLSPFKQMETPHDATHVGFTSQVPNSSTSDQVHAFFDRGRQLSSTIHQKSPNGNHRSLSPDSRKFLEPQVRSGAQLFESEVSAAKMEMEEKEEKRKRAYQSLAVPPAPRRSPEQMDRLGAMFDRLYPRDKTDHK